MSDRDARGTIFSLAVAASLLLTSCSGNGGSTATGGMAPARLMPITLAMSWRADLPCADCAAIRTTVTLHPDGSYRRDDAYLGKSEAGDTLFGEVGIWTLDQPGERVTLHGSGEESAQFLSLADGNLRMLDRSGDEIASEHDYTLIHLPNPVPQVGIVRLSGTFTYLADSARLIECRSGLHLPVAMQGEYLALESVYLERGLSGAPLVVNLRGRVEELPAMEGIGSESTFVVESFEIPESPSPCPSLDLSPALADREWQLEWVWGDVAGEDDPAGETPTLLWRPDETNLSGNTGCNQFTGRGVLRGSLLVASEVASTRKFCEGAMEREARLLSLFSNPLVVRIEGEELILYRRGEVAAVYRLP